MPETPEVQSQPVIDSVLSKFQLIQITQIKPSRHQARKDFSGQALKGLAESMRQEGLQNPITVRQAGYEFELVAGERRLRAAKLLKWTTIEAKVIQPVSEAESAAKGLIENLQREDLNPVEEAEGFQEMRNLNDSHWTQERVAVVTGKSPDYVSRSLALLKLPSEIVEKLRQRNFSREHGIELLRLNNANQQKGMANEIVKGGWSVKQTREAISQKLKKTSPSKTFRAKGDGVSIPADPLTDFWPGLLANPAIATPFSWQVAYGPQKMTVGATIIGWNFIVTTPGMVPKAELAKWFRNMADAFGDTSQQEAVAQSAKERSAPATEAEFKQMEEDQKNLRLPKTDQERAELEALAGQGPAAVYAWIFGPNSFMANKMQSATWADMNISDPAAGCRQLIEGLKTLQE